MQQGRQQWEPDALAIGVAGVARVYEEAGRMVDVDALIDAVIGREGGYVNDPTDRGGATIWGITEAVARQQGYAGEMRAMPRETAVEIYKRLYWLRPAYDQIAQRSAALAEAMFDAAVNMGPATAGTYLQRALNVLNRGAADYPDVAIDGAVGARTLAALDGYLARRAAEDGVLLLLFVVVALREARYVELAERDPGQEKYEFGWQHRTLDLLRKLAA